MPRAIINLLVALLLFSHIHPSCVSVRGLKSPSHMINKLVNTLFQSLDLYNKTEDLVLVSLLQNTSQTRFKVLFKVIDTQKAADKYFIGIQTEYSENSGGSNHKILQYVQSHVSRDVSSILGVNFENRTQTQCKSLRNDFIDYFSTNPSIIEWFAKYFNIDVFSKDKSKEEKNLELIQQLKKENESLKDRIASVSAELASAKANSEQSTKQFEEDMRKERARMQGTINELKDKLTTVKASKKEVDKEMSALMELDNTNVDTNKLESCEKELVTLRDSLTLKSDKMKEEKAKCENNVDTLKNRNEIQLQKVNEEKDNSIKMMKKDFEERLETRMRNIDREIEEAVVKALQDVTSKLQKKEEELERLKENGSSKGKKVENKEISEIQQRLEHKDKELLAFRKQSIAEIQRLQLESQTALKKLEEIQKQKIVRMTEQKLQEIQALIQTKKSDLSRMEMQNDDQIKAAVEAKTRDLTKLVQDQASALQNAEERLQKIFLRLGEQKENEISDLVDHKDREKNQTANLRVSTDNESKAEPAMLSRPNQADSELKLRKKQKQYHQSPLELINGMENSFNRLIDTRIGPETNQDISLNQKAAITQKFIGDLSVDQTRLLEEYLIFIAGQFNTDPFSISEISFDQIPFILTKLKEINEDKQVEPEVKRQPSLLDIIQQMQMKNKNVPLHDMNDAQSSTEIAARNSMDMPSLSQLERGRKQVLPSETRNDNEEASELQTNQRNKRSNPFLLPRSMTHSMQSNQMGTRNSSEIYSSFGSRRGSNSDRADPFRPEEQNRNPFVLSF